MDDFREVKKTLWLIGSVMQMEGGLCCLLIAILLLERRKAPAAGGSSTRDCKEKGWDLPRAVMRGVEQAEIRSRRESTLHKQP